MDECQHEQTALRYRNGDKALIGHQCVKCLSLVGKWVKHSEIEDLSKVGFWVDPTPQPIDYEELERKEKERRDADSMWRRIYDDYLKSPEWKRRRKKIFDRANGICEGCLSRPATQVHHLSYKHVTKEFAFELVALCENCHDRYHREADERHEKSR